jgi:hypothetical protein
MSSIVQQLELDGDIIVTLSRLTEVMAEVGRSGSREEARSLAYELQRAGWLGPLRTRGAWEFLPGARGGAYGSGDRFIEFRAQDAVNPGWHGVLAMESAASLLGLAQRIPKKEVVALPPECHLPKALSHDWRFLRLVVPPQGLATISGMRSWNLEGLIFGIAVRPSSYEDVAGLAQWLPEGADHVDVDTLIALLRSAKPTARQRAAYILGIAGATSARSAIIAEYPPEETAWLGKRVAGTSVFDAETNVNDALLHQYMSVGTGS